MITEKEIIDKYLGTPFMHRGRSMAGFDCYGLLIAIYADMEFKIPDIKEEYDLHWSKGNTQQSLYEEYHKRWVKVDKPELFDVILFKNSRNIANHGGVCLSGERFIQCSQRVGVIIKAWTGEHWVKNFEGFYHLKARDVE